MTAADVVVVGSANVDVVLRVAAIPRPGETVLAEGRTQGAGGKGANQAAAAALLGARTSLVAAVGDDDGARLLRDALERAGVDTSGLRTTSTPTGSAVVVVESSGENAIVVDAGANADLTELTDDELTRVRAARVVVCQLEVPVPTVLQALATGRAGGALTVLNAAPAQSLPEELTDVVDVLVVNEGEALQVAGKDSVDAALEVLLTRVPCVVVTLGPRGALVAERGAPSYAVPGVPAREVVDTTGAGDTFCGAFAAGRAAGDDTQAAVRTACVAASLSVERAGASSSMPDLETVRAREA